jgi:hypothetical protein
MQPQKRKAIMSGASPAVAKMAAHRSRCIAPSPRHSKPIMRRVIVTAAPEDFVGTARRRLRFLFLQCQEKRQQAASASMLIKFTEFGSWPSLLVGKWLSLVLFMYAFRDASTPHFSSPTIWLA